MIAIGEDSRGIAEDLIEAFKKAGISEGEIRFCPYKDPYLAAVRDLGVVANEIANSVENHEGKRVIFLDLAPEKEGPVDWGLELADRVRDCIKLHENMVQLMRDSLYLLILRTVHDLSKEKLCSIWNIEDPNSFEFYNRSDLIESGVPLSQERNRENGFVYCLDRALASEDQIAEKITDWVRN